jgi:hypothetical protein
MLYHRYASTTRTELIEQWAEDQWTQPTIHSRQHNEKRPTAWHTQTQYIPGQYVDSIDIQVSPSLNKQLYLTFHDITFIHPLIKTIFITDCIYSHHIGLNVYYNNKIILLQIGQF